VTLVSTHGRTQQFFVGCRDALAVAAEDHIQVDRPKSGPVALLGMQYPARTCPGVDEQDDLVRVDDLVGLRKAK